MGRGEKIGHKGKRGYKGKKEKKGKEGNEGEGEIGKGKEET